MEKIVRWVLVMVTQTLMLLGLGMTLACAQVPSVGAPFISNFGAKLYNADAQNWVSVQDTRGVMYFGNSKGILEFDGQRWRLVETTATVRALTIAADGTIFYGSIGDIGYLSASPTGKLSAVSLRDLLPKEERSFNDVWQAESTPQGVYFLTRSRIFRFHQGKMTALAGKFAASQAVVLNGALMYADIDKGLCLIDGDQIHPLPQLAGLYDNKRITLARFAAHELLVGRTSGDFRHVDLSSLWDPAAKRYDPKRVATVPVQPFVTEVDRWLTEDQGLLYKLVPLGTDAFAISTIKAGILVFDRAGKLLRAINKNSGLADDSVGGLMVDRTSNLWAATNSGISYIELSVPQSQFGVVNGIEGRALSARYYEGRLYIGTYQNVYVQEPFVFNLKNDVPRFSPLKQGTNQVWQLLEVDGDLLAATGRGLNLITAVSAVPIAGPPDNAYCLAVTPR